MRRTRLSALLAPPGLAAACCSSTGPDAEQLAAARERWAARAPASYVSLFPTVERRSAIIGEARRSVADDAVEYTAVGLPAR